MTIEFEAFPKIARLKRACTITEKLDGTNAQIIIADDGVTIGAASRTRLITPSNDNYGFAGWVERNKAELLKLGPGRHFGEWWGNGIQRGYGLKGGDKRFTLFNVSRWENAELPACVSVVPKLYEGPFGTDVVDKIMAELRRIGSLAVPGFMKPEGIVVWHAAARQLFKVTCENDHEPKGIAA